MPIVPATKHRDGAVELSPMGAKGYQLTDTTTAMVYYTFDDFEDARDNKKIAQQVQRTGW